MLPEIVTSQAEEPPSFQLFEGHPPTSKGRGKKVRQHSYLGLTKLPLSDGLNFGRFGRDISFI